MTKTAAAPWLTPLALLALLGSALTGCGGSSGQQAAGSPSAPASASASSPASSSSSSAGAGPTAPTGGFASTSAGTPKGVLSKPDFLIQMNAVCSAVDAQQLALPIPTGATDFAAISLNLSGTLRLVPSLIDRAERLVAKMPERAELEKNWLAVERTDFAAFKPIAQRMVTHSNARDAAKVQADANALSALPNHDDDLMDYLEGFGLASCAHLHAG